MRHVRALHHHLCAFYHTVCLALPDHTQSRIGRPLKQLSAHRLCEQHAVYNKLHQVGTAALGIMQINRDSQTPRLFGEQRILS